MIPTNNRLRPGMGKNIILCLDGTSNSFGAGPETNVLKLFRMLEKDSPNQLVYYQPGIGTHITVDLPKTIWSAAYSYAEKIVDIGIAWSLDAHIIAAYMFLMKHHCHGDRIYLYGFSRGAFTARILAGMLDRVGLLSPGQNELVPCAWEIYKTWEAAGQPMEDKTSNLACSFKSTFSVPSVCVYFMGLWDSINSSGIILDRSFPYTSSAGIVHHIRHAVGIDERRAKFKQNLFVPHCYNPTLFGPSGIFAERQSPELTPETSPQTSIVSSVRVSPVESRQHTPKGSMVILRHPTSPVPISASTPVLASGSSIRTTASGRRFPCSSRSELSHMFRAHSEQSHMIGTQKIRHRPERSGDLVELWFPGDHGDVGGGWLPRGSPHLLSDIPLAWILSESVKFKVIFKEGVIDEFRNNHDSEECLIAPMHDSLNLFRRQGENGRGEDPWWRPWFWWFLETMPVAYRVENEEEKWTRVAVPNYGRARTIPMGAKFHWSVAWRMRLVDGYRPFDRSEDDDGSSVTGGGSSSDEYGAIPDDFDCHDGC
ncbi:Conserved hypothetical protein [Yarrowia lipolytica]|nr:Conserved hypothetical protein [Yarrowia lipolytica]